MSAYSEDENNSSYDLLTPTQSGAQPRTEWPSPTASDHELHPNQADWEEHFGPINEVQMTGDVSLFGMGGFVQRDATDPEKVNFIVFGI